MNNAQKEQLQAFLRDQLAQAEFRTRAYVYDDQGQKNPNRNAFLRLNKYLNDFLKGNRQIRWLAMPGLRGAGKTTLLAQLYQGASVPVSNKLFLSVDQVTQVFGVSLKDVLQVYEEQLGPFEKLQEPVLLFLDEIQYDPDWAGVLKSIYDRTRNVFVIVTGSSALLLNTNPDVARRVVSEKLWPMSFTEYIKITSGKFEAKGVGGALRGALFNSASAEEVLQHVREHEQAVNRYWLDIGTDQVTRYLRYGTLPFVAKLDSEAMIYDLIKKTLDRVISVDLPMLGQFEQEQLAKVPMILYAIADSDQISLHTLAQDIETSRPTLTRLLTTLEQTELLIRVLPYGAHRKQVKRPSRYFFTSSAFRSMFFNFIGSTRQHGAQHDGRLLEDAVALYLTRCLAAQPGFFVTYDSAEGGADFIVGQEKSRVAIEAGLGRKDFGQLHNSIDKVGARYGLLVSDSELGLDRSGMCVSVPLRYFLLI